MNFIRFVSQCFRLGFVFRGNSSFEEVNKRERDKERRGGEREGGEREGERGREERGGDVLSEFSSSQSLAEAKAALRSSLSFSVDASMISAES